MDERAILHTPESKYCFALNERTICLRLRISKNDLPEKIAVLYGGKYSFAIQQNKVEMSRSNEDRLYAYYTVSIPITDVRFVYIFEITYKNHSYYYSEDGLTEKYDFELSYYNCFQYAYINKCDLIEPVGWLNTATFYQIFIDRFAIGNSNKNYITMNWNDIPTPKSFAGGDLRGIINKLSYLSKLGINALYLTPIFRSISNHKYDISDYFAIDEQFGTKEDLKELVQKAHSMEIKIVLDAVFNHCSDQFAPFQDVLKNGKKSKYFDWFIITKEEPLEYEMFGSCAYMPKFNTSNPEVCSYLIQIGVYWIKQFDIDGWRLDVSDEVSHDFWRQFRKAVKAEKASCVLIGENWHDANQYLRGDQFDSIMNYAFTKACLDFYAFNEYTACDLANKLNELLMRNTDITNNMMLNLLDTHDTHRFLTRVEGNKDKLMSALALTYFFPGVPCIYYGTENAMEGGYDPDCRRTINWKLEQQENKVKSLIYFLTELKHNLTFANEKVTIYEEEQLLILKRGSYQLIINQSKKDKNIKNHHVIYSNRYEDNLLKNDGFVVVNEN